MKKSIKLLFILLNALFSVLLFAQDCKTFFPDALQSTANNGTLRFEWQSRVINSPDNILDTRDLSDGAGSGNSCNGVSCSQSGGTVSNNNYNNFPNNSNNITLNYQQQQTITPGTYNTISVGSEATLYLQSGLYQIRNSLTLQSQARLVVVSGTALVMVRGDVTTNYQSTLNNTGTPDQLLVYSRGNINLGSSSAAKGFLFARGDSTLNSQASVVGALTVSSATLNSPSSITYDAPALSLAQFEPFCSTVSSALPAVLAHYRLETNPWNGASGEVVDSGPNGFDGRAVIYSGNYPSSSNAAPAITGDPGTCRHGVFNGTNSGHLRVEDSNALDLPTNLSVGVWIKPTARPSGGGLYTIVSKDENFEFHLTSSGDINWWWGGGARSLTTSGLNLANNTWHHIAITYEVGEQKIYVNGVQRAVTNYNGNMTTNGDPLLIGTDWAFDSRNFNGHIDEVVVFDETLNAAQVVTLRNLTHACNSVPILAYFVIDVGGANASVCQPKQITITAYDNNNALFTTYDGTVAISTSTNDGDWSLVDGSVAARFSAGASDSGTATFSFDPVDLGQVQLTLGNQHAQTLTVRAQETNPNSGVSNVSSNIIFSENAFVVNRVDSLVDDVIAGRNHQFQLEMWRQDPSSGQCSIASNYAANTIKAWLVRDGQDPGGALPAIQTVSETQILPSAEPGTGNLDYPFVAGSGAYQLVTTDVGKYVVYFKDDASGFSDQPILGDQSVIVRPFAFDVQVPGNQAGVAPSDPAFIPAGQNFKANVRAVLWSPADDVNVDGIADGHADGDSSTGTNLADNMSAPSFGREVAAQGINLSALLIAPSGGNDPGLGNGESSGDGRILTSLSSGAGQSGDVYFGEVGAIEMNSRVSSGNYLGAGARTNKIVGSAYVGRFYPAAFDLTPVNLVEACSNFTYMEQSFSAEYKLTAQNARPSAETTANYVGAFAKLGNGLGSFSYGASGLSADLTSRISGPTTAVTWLAGEASVTLDPIAFARQSTAVPDGPIDMLAVGVQVLDGDNVGLNTASLDLDVDGDSVNEHGLLGETRQLFGRLYAKDGFGPESTNIPMFWQTEYYDGARFVRNDSDSCTELAFSQINFVGATSAIDVAAQSIAVTLGGVTSSFSFADPLGVQTCMTATGVGFCRGYAGRYYGATNAVVTYPVQINLTNYPYLRFNWDGQGSAADLAHPQFNINFSSYRGHDRIIFWRERL